MFLARVNYFVVFINVFLLHAQFDGWKDSVLKTTWSRDGQHLAICDMSGSVKVRRVIIGGLTSL